MGRSTETFGKKEREKAKLKKQKDKKEKAEERKNNQGKSSFEEMLAYVDENGNISSTPPDPSKKRTVNAEDIEIGIAKQSAEETEVVRTGKVTFFNESKGYGFIVDQQTQESIFVHINGLIDPVKENDKVTFETEKGQKGLNAIKVKKK